MDDGSRGPLSGLVEFVKKSVNQKSKQDDMTDEIISMVDEAHEQGVLEQSEAEMIQNIFEFDDTSVGDIMTPCKHVVAFDYEDLLQNVIDKMLEEDNSRYPVFEEDMDNIKGIIHYKDAFRFIVQNPWAKFKPLKELPGLIRKAAFVPETGNVAKLLKTMQAKHTHMAIVVDEYGQTSGIVTMEDILEEIVGEILDEYDEEEKHFRKQEDDSMIIDGMADLEEVAEFLHIDLDDEDMDTLSGYLTGILGHIPTEKDLNREIETNGYRFKILSLGKRTIGSVRAEKVKEETKGDRKTCQDIQNSQT